MVSMSISTCFGCGGGRAVDGGREEEEEDGALSVVHTASQ